MADKTKIRARGILKGQLTRFSSFITNNEEGEVDYRIVESRYESFKNLMIKFDALQSDIEETSLESEKTTAEQTSERVKFEDEYYGLEARFIRLLSRAQEARDHSFRSSASEGAFKDNRVRLPQIELPKFDGKLVEYQSFREVFCSLVDNNHSLSNVDKLMYLRASLGGEALRLIESLPTTSENYDHSWVLLKNRYENVRYLKQAHLRALFELPAVSRNSVSSLRNVIDTVSRSVMSLNAIGERVQYWDSILLYLINSKLDSDTRRLVEERFGSNEEITFIKLRRFLEDRCAMLDRLSEDTERPKPLLRSVNRDKCLVSGLNSDCKICTDNHVLWKCPSFLRLEPRERREKVRELKLCFRCLEFSHFSRDCSAPKCTVCQANHHELLHFRTESYPSRKEPVSLALTKSPDRRVLLFTCLVRIKRRRGDDIIARCLLDSGSQINFISSSLLRRLGMSPKSVNRSVDGIGGNGCELRSRLELDLMSTHDDYSLSIEAYVIEKITSYLPQENCASPELSNFTRGFTLADNGFESPGPIDILLSNSVFMEILLNDMRTFNESVKMISTRFGWIVGGKLSEPASEYRPVTCLVNLSEEQSFDLTRFWELEETPSIVREPSLAELAFKNSFCRDHDGRFVVQLPFIAEPSDDSSYSKSFALHRFKLLERRFLRSPSLRRDYDVFMADYMHRNYIERVPDREIENAKSYYLPHHGVVKRDSLTTKLRVVFSGKDTAANCRSINSLLETGPKLQNDLVRSLLRFRGHRIAFAADIEKMYCQIRISREHRDYLRFFYRFESEPNCYIYRLMSLPFGLNCSPFLAIRCLLELAEINTEKYPEASRIVREDFYVDDVLSGAESVSEAQSVCKQLVEICAQGGFVLRKWKTNSSSLRSEFVGELEGDTKDFVFDESESKVLGMRWHAAEDSLSYDVTSWTNAPCTKRNLLSWLAKFFDPLGLLSPVLIIGKILIQRLWILKADWDDPVPDDIERIWLRLMLDLPRLLSFSLPRFVPYSSETIVMAFCDASEQAYGCCIYFVVDGGLKLIFSRSRVAPIKIVSLARLELCAAVICSRAVSYVIECFGIVARNCYCFTDSKIVLSWLAKPSYCWKTFVANRVSEIQTTVPECKWLHVRSSDNPADIVSRGMTPVELIGCSLWWAGPSDFKTLLDSRVKDTFSTDLEMNSRFLAEISLHMVDASTSANEVVGKLFDRISSLTKIIRVYAWILRFISNIRKRNLESRSAMISVEEAEYANMEMIKSIQRRYFGESIRRIKNKELLKRSDPLLALNPFIDENSTLRVGGRIESSELSFDRKHPIILPKKSEYTYAVIRDEHVRHNHLGAVGLTSVLRQRFWIVNSRNSIRSVIRKCFRCFRYRPCIESQMMGDLPMERTEVSRAFFRVGVDLCGPFLVRPVKRRGNTTKKCYVALFVCMSTKAVHLELVFDLTADSFLASFRRFCGRRGLPKTVFTDNATNFVGASNVLKEWYLLLSSGDFTTEFHANLLKERIEWKFIPPRSPNFGGLWESHIKTFKTLFLRSAGSARLTIEEFGTLMTQVEASLNSRPICTVTENSDDLNALTPGHFLIGQPLKMLPCPISHEFTGRLSKRWLYVQELYSEFWRRWSAEYLHELQARKRNQTRKPNLRVGDVGLVVDDLQPPLYWRLGRIVEVFPGKDGLVRVISIQTGSGCVKRSVRGFCRFDFASSQNGGEDVEASE